MGESHHAFTPIIGVVDRLQVPWVSAGGWGSEFFDSSKMAVLIPAAQKKLFDISRARVITKSQTFSQVRTEAYKDDRGLVVILGVVCASLLAVTAFGIVGLTSYWVAQRRRQIGIRRALGATRTAIIQYFQTENLLIAGAGAAVGVALALSLNLWLVSAFAMERLHTSYAFVGAVAVLVLGQVAVLGRR